MTSEISIVARLNGRFRIESSDGQDLTPRSAKTQALLALLLTETHLGRNRAWLQDKLWSDRAPEQGAASLRQALTEIRRCWRALGDILITDRKSVSLDPGRVCIRRDEDGEFLEGLDVRDSEFATWLATERNRDAGSKRDTVTPALPPLATTRLRGSAPRIVLRFDCGKSRQLETVRHVFLDFVLCSLRENLMITAQLDDGSDLPPGTLVIEAQAINVTEDKLTLSVTLDDTGNRGRLWSEVCFDVPFGDDPRKNDRLLAIVYRLCEAVGDAALGHAFNIPYDRDANLLANLALRKIFKIEADELEQADALLKQASEIEARGVFDAWRALIVVIQFFERFESDTQLLREKAEAFCGRALSADPMNSSVLAAASSARMALHQDFAAGYELASTGLRANPSNPLAWHALSNAFLHAGDYESGYRMAVQGQRLSEGTRLKFWSDFQRSMCAATIGRPVEAMRYCVSSNALSPSFRPALRYLILYCSGQGLLEKAMSYADRLRQCEPGFSIDRLIDDPDYPARMMHKANLIQGGDLRVLI